MKGPKSLLARVGAVAGAAVVSSVALVGLAAPAHAADLGSITLTPTSGTVDANPMFTSVTTATACPTGYGTNVAVKIGRVGGPYNNLNTVYSDGGYDTAPLSLAANRSFTRANGNVAPAAGLYEVVIICTSETQGDLPDVFRSINIEVTGANWAVKVAAPAEDTTTTLAVSPASPQVAGTSVTLTATVAPAAAAGTVEFKRGATVIGTAPVAAGVATLTTTTLPVGTANLSASFVPANSAAYKASASAAVPFTVSQPAGSISNEQEITGDIAPGAFSLNVAGTTVPLIGGTVGGTATGSLNTATVVDLRGNNAGWNLTGQVEDFTGAGTIPGNNLGWAPTATKVSGSGAVIVGAASPNGLGTSKTLCSAAPTTNAGTFTCGGAVSLAIPDNVAPGTYSATLTLTLV
ncbi:WxL domain-containing protein [Dactylosporangium sp. NBC_01737]|uniref:Ig-like domain repeat protein n=1 Tax=Dactylosporangium sp. NBC_01737 TaxID=2975959 RepID=UPI002E122B58|nr:WxL domain-containing protein [Dactylosporangium sp. NBC_01737]